MEEKIKNPNINKNSNVSITLNEKTIININNQNLKIETEEIYSVLNNTTRKYIYSLNYIEKSINILNYFYVCEKDCLKYIQNFPFYKRKFYKNLIYESLKEIIESGPKEKVQEILNKLEKIKKIVKESERKNKLISLEEYNKKLETEFGIKNVPKSLIRDDLKLIKNINIINNNLNENKKNLLEKPEVKI